VKETVGTILVFALALVAVFSGLLLLYFFPLFGDLHVPGLGAPAIGSYLQRYIPEILVLTTIICLFLLFGRLKRKPGKPFISYVVVLAGSFVLATAALTVDLLEYEEPKNPLLAESVHPLSDDIQLYVDEVEGDRTLGLVFSRRNTLGDRRFQAFDSGEVDARRGILEIPERGITVPLEPRNPFFSRMFIQNRSFGWILEPIRSFLAAATEGTMPGNTMATGDTMATGNTMAGGSFAGEADTGVYSGGQLSETRSFRGIEYRFFLIASGIILIMSSHWLIHRNDWPLGNAVITVLLFCGFFLLHALMKSELLREFLFFTAGRRATERIGPFLPLLGIWYFSLVFLLSRGKAYLVSRRILRSL
jgi:hypothetical protein